MPDAHSASGNTDATGAATARAKENLPEAREARVAELRRCYQEGAYSVDSAKVSASLIDRHLQK